MKAKKRRLLWEISTPEGIGKSYVFGTMHVKDPSVFGLLSVVHEKIDAVEGFANEFDMRTPPSLSPEYTRLPADGTLSSLLKPKVYHRLGTLVQQHLGTPIAAFEKTLPLLLSNMLAEHILSADMPYSLDESLFRYAAAKEKQCFGIETANEQLEILKHISIPFQVKALQRICNRFGSYRRELLRMRAYYEEQAIDKLYHITRKGLGGMRKILLYDRNHIMADRIGAQSRQMTALYAIGAAHLWGEKGVLRLLKQQGFQVKPAL